MRTLLKWLGFLFLAFVFYNWMTAGQDEIVEGPPETPETVLITPSE